MIATDGWRISALALLKRKGLKNHHFLKWIWSQVLISSFHIFVLKQTKRKLSNHNQIGDLFLNFKPSRSNNFKNCVYGLIRRLMTFLTGTNCGFMTQEHKYHCRSNYTYKKRIPTTLQSESNKFSSSYVIFLSPDKYILLKMFINITFTNE